MGEEREGEKIEQYKEAGGKYCFICKIQETGREILLEMFTNRMRNDEIPGERKREA